MRWNCTVESTVRKNQSHSLGKEKANIQCFLKEIVRVVLAVEFARKIRLYFDDVVEVSPLRSVNLEAFKAYDQPLTRNHMSISRLMKPTSYRYLKPTGVDMNLEQSQSRSPTITMQV